MLEREDGRGAAKGGGWGWRSGSQHEVVLDIDQGGNASVRDVLTLDLLSVLVAPEDVDPGSRTEEGVLMGVHLQ